MYKLYVFDFHGTLTFEATHLNKVIKPKLRAYRKTPADSWYDAMVKSDMKPTDLMPTIDYVIEFTDQHKDVYFGVASAIEYEEFIWDTVRYCYDKSNATNPFIFDRIVSTSKYEQIPKIDRKIEKLSHIELMLNTINDHIEPYEILLIDNSKRSINVAADAGIGTYLVTAGNFFTGIDLEDASSPNSKRTKKSECLVCSSAAHYREAQNPTRVFCSEKCQIKFYC